MMRIHEISSDLVKIHEHLSKSDSPGPAWAQGLAGEPLGPWGPPKIFKHIFLYMFWLRFELPSTLFLHFYAALRFLTLGSDEPKSEATFGLW